MKAVVVVVGIIAAGISAGCWFWASIVKPSYPMAYLGGPPKEVKERIDLQARLNAIGAAFSGITVICQGILMYLPDDPK